MIRCGAIRGSWAYPPTTARRGCGTAFSHLPAGIEVAHHALTYDHGAAARRIRAATGLPGAYADALESGIWPSLDILPAAERAATGHPLAPAPALWRY